MSGHKTLPTSFLLPIIITLLMSTPALAYFVPLFGREHFEDSLRYPDSSRESYLIKDMDPSEAASRNGIIISGEGRSTLTTHKVEDFFQFNLYIGERVIEHVPTLGQSSACEGIVIRFKYPVKKFGVSLGRASIYANLNIYPETASLLAYSDSGLLLGTTEVGSDTQGEGDPTIVYTTFGFETTSGPGVTTVILDYGESEVPERIDHIYYEYKDPWPFKAIFPQIAHGTVSGASIECDLFVYWDRSVTIRTYSPNGGLLPDPILNEGNNFTLSVEDLPYPQGEPTQRLFKSTTIPGSEDLTIGFAKAESDYPVGGQVVYRTTDADGKVYEADIRACTEETYLQIPFEVNQDEQLNAALAIVNPSNTYARVELHFYDADQEYTDFLNPPEISLKPWEQRSVFMWELWAQIPSEDNNYTLQLRSAVPFAAAAFYTRNWIVVGNLPVWSYKEGQAR